MLNFLEFLADSSSFFFKKLLEFSIGTQISRKLEFLNKIVLELSAKGQNIEFFITLSIY